MRKPRRFPKRGYTDSMTSHQVLLALSLGVIGTVWIDAYRDHVRNFAG